MADLLALTEALPDSAFFLEHSRTRELAYIVRSYGRWLDTLRLVRKRLANPGELSCLDVGTSPFTFMLKDHFGKTSTLDLSGAYRARCETAGIRFYEGGVASDQAVAQVEKVDCVFFLETLEHLHANPVKVLARLRSVLRAGGLLVLSTPNMMCLANRGLMLLNRKLRHFTYPPFNQDDRDHGFAHDRIYMPSELREYFEASGFRELETLYQLYSDGVSEHQGLLRRAWASAILLLKHAVPSFRDGVVLLGRNTGSTSPVCAGNQPERGS
jgi:SAM-dependent methyltransferase